MSGGTISSGTLSSPNSTGAYPNTYDVRSGTVTATLTDYTDPVTAVVTSVGLTKTTTGLVYLNAAASFTGKVVISAGTLLVHPVGGLGTAPATLVTDQITIADGATLEFNNTETVPGTAGTYLSGGMATINDQAGTQVIYNSPITGPGGLIKDGPSNVRMGGTNDYAGDTDIRAGWLSLTYADINSGDHSGITPGLPYGPGKGNVIVEANGSLNIQDATTAMNGLNGSGQVIKSEPSGTRNISIGNNNANGTFSGVIGLNQQYNLISITKVGTGTQVFSGTSSYYTGNTTVTAGTLSVAMLTTGGLGSSIGVSSAASSSLTVGSATDPTTATLQYIGTGDTTDRRFTVGLSAAFDASGTGPIQFIPAAGMGMGYIGTGAKTVILTGTNTGNNIMNVKLVDTDSPTSLVKSGSGKWMSTIDQPYTGNTSVLNGILSLQDINTPNATVSVTGGQLIANSITANTLILASGGDSLSPVPEPSTWALLILAGLMFGIYRRRSR